LRDGRWLLVLGVEDLGFGFMTLLVRRFMAYLFLSVFLKFSVEKKCTLTLRGYAITMLHLD